MKHRVTVKDRIYSLIAMLFYFAGFYLIYYYANKWVAIGASLMLISVYFGLQSKSIFPKKKEEEIDEK